MYLLFFQKLLSCMSLPPQMIPNTTDTMTREVKVRSSSLRVKVGWGSSVPKTVVLIQKRLTNIRNQEWKFMNRTTFLSNFHKMIFSELR